MPPSRKVTLTLDGAVGFVSLCTSAVKGEQMGRMVLSHEPLWKLS